MQILLGPRQVGKTTAVRQALAGVGLPHHYASARDVAGGAHGWTASVWETARFRMKAAGCPSFVLVLDDVEQVPDWTEAVKGEWDADTRNRVDIRVLIAGSSRAFLMKGLTESLMGRFEEIRMPHWNFPEMEAAFGLSLDEYVWFGGLPVGMAFRHDDARRRACVESAAESSLLLDVLRDDDVQKPPLLREAFRLGAAASGEELSLTKLMARLSDAGNTTTLTAYFAKCREAGLLAALGKFSGEQPRRRAARPRFQVFDNGVLSALCAKSFRAVREDPAAWGAARRLRRRGASSLGRLAPALGRDLLARGRCGGRLRALARGCVDCGRCGAAGRGVRQGRGGAFRFSGAVRLLPDVGGGALRDPVGGIPAGRSGGAPQLKRRRGLTFVRARSPGSGASRSRASVLPARRRDTDRCRRRSPHPATDGARSRRGARAASRARPWLRAPGACG